jgi:CHAT domain-containing protein/Tfp pilus assembly protein PilF
MNNLAMLYAARGDYARAEPLLRQAVGFCKEALGEGHPHYAASVNNLALLYEERGELARAEPLYQEALRLAKEREGADHPAHAIALSNLAMLYLAMGDGDRAEKMLWQAAEINRKALGERHARYATSLNNLGELYGHRGDDARAAPLLRQALAITAETVGAEHPSYAISLSNLSNVYLGLGDFDEAERLLLQAERVQKKAGLGGTRIYAVTLNNLASVYNLRHDVARGDAGRGVELLLQVRGILEQALGKQHPDYAKCLLNLAAAHQRAGAAERARPLLREAVRVFRGQLELASAVQSERQQLTMLRDVRIALDNYLSLARAGQVDAAEAYQEVLAWKGSVFTRQRWLRLARQHPDLAGAVDELRQTAGQLAALAAAVPDAKGRAAWQERLSGLQDHKETLEKKLADRSAVFRRQRTQAQRSPADVRAALPAGAALLDLVVYTDYSAPREGKGAWERKAHVLAFVLRPDRPLVQVDLGPLAPIADAIRHWRASFAADGAAPADKTDPGAELRRLLWQPLEKNLDGVHTVLVSPDGALARFPLAALPGTKPGTYLIEELLVAVVPVPQLLPELLTRSRPQETVAASSLLLVGDVDFGAAATTGAARGAGRLHFAPLPATAREMDAVAGAFRHRHPGGDVREVRRAAATKAALRGLAPGRRYLHLATHGFFAPPGLKSALEAAGGEPGAPRAHVLAVDPGLLSGLALAGANRDPAATEVGADTGILTAQEVAELDLSAGDLVVLSACETGLGEEAGGEGLLGLQRAFQVSGSRAVVASLWQVDDEATQELMRRFYDNLWGKGMGRLQALRQAQLSILHGASASSVPRGPGEPVEGGARSRGRAHPRLWAAWVLSGDPGDLTPPPAPAVANPGEDGPAAVAAVEPAPAEAWPYLAGALVVLAVVAWLGWRRRPRRA